MAPASRPRRSTTSARPMPTLAQKIMDNMFTFDDLNKIDDKGIRPCSGEVQSEALVVALGASRPSCARRSSATCPPALPRRCARTRIPRPRAVVRGRGRAKEMLKIVRRLVDEGQIVLPPAATTTIHPLIGAHRSVNCPAPAALSGAGAARHLLRFIPRRRAAGRHLEPQPAGEAEASGFAPLRSVPAGAALPRPLLRQHEPANPPPLTARRAARAQPARAADAARRPVTRTATATVWRWTPSAELRPVMSAPDRRHRGQLRRRVPRTWRTWPDRGAHRRRTSASGGAHRTSTGPS